MDSTKKIVIFYLVMFVILTAVGAIYVGWLKAALGIGGFFVFKFFFGEDAKTRGGDHGGPDS